MQYFAGKSAPADWLLCNGQAVSRTDYEELFEVLGETYGSGDGSKTFNLPDLIGRFAEGGTDVGTKKEAGLPNIKGTLTKRQSYVGYDFYDGAGVFQTEKATCNNLAPGNGQQSDTSVIHFDASKSNAIYGTSETVQPASLTLLPIIKAK